MTFTKEWWIAVLNRTIRTMAQTALGIIGGSLLVSEVDWMTVLSATALAGILCVLMALAGLPETEAIKQIQEQRAVNATNKNKTIAKNKLGEIK